MGGDYPRTESIFADAEARIELAKQLVERFASHADSPAELYAVKTRKIPIETVRACADLRYLPSQIEGRPPVDHALVSLLRDAAGETTGFQFEYCDILGARAAAARLSRPSVYASTAYVTGCSTPAAVPAMSPIYAKGTRARRWP
jgi:hypothetical protein